MARIVKSSRKKVRRAGKGAAKAGKKAKALLTRAVGKLTGRKKKKPARTIATAVALGAAAVGAGVAAARARKRKPVEAVGTEGGREGSPTPT